MSSDSYSPMSGTKEQDIIGSQYILPEKDLDEKGENVNISLQKPYLNEVRRLERTHTCVDQHTPGLASPVGSDDVSPSMGMRSYTGYIRVTD